MQIAHIIGVSYIYLVDGAVLGIYKTAICKWVKKSHNGNGVRDASGLSDFSTYYLNAALQG